MPLKIDKDQEITIGEIKGYLDNVPNDCKLFIRKLSSMTWKDDSHRWQGENLDYIISWSDKENFFDIWIE